MKPSFDENFRSWIKEYGKLEYEHFQMEGKALPDFNFVDLNGREYNKENVLGKILVLKCWFIKCTACIEEMPVLNKLIKQYENRKDILFVSLALDKKVELQSFLKNREFNYAVIPNQEKYILDDLKIKMMPTHIIVNKQGSIAKVVNGSDELIIALKSEMSKS